MAGGDKDWLEGEQSTTLPKKLKAIAPRCVEFAYKPWIMKDSRIMV